MPTPGSSLCFAGEVAELLGVSVRTVNRLAERGELDVVRIGRGARFRADDVRALIERSREERAP